MSNDFVDSPLTGFTPPSAPYKGGPGMYNGEEESSFGEYKRTPSPNAVPEKIRDGSVGKPSGEPDQF